MTLQSSNVGQREQEEEEEEVDEGGAHAKEGRGSKYMDTAIISFVEVVRGRVFGMALSFLNQHNVKHRSSRSHSCPHCKRRLSTV